MIDENLRNDDRPNGLIPRLAWSIYRWGQPNALIELTKKMLDKQKKVYQAYVARYNSDLETTTGQKMAVAMGLIDDVTTSTLQI